MASSNTRANSITGVVNVAPPPQYGAGGRVELPAPGNIQQLPLRLIDGMPYQDYINSLQGRILDAVDYRAFDTRIVIAATNVVAGNYDFFNIPIGGSENSLDGGTTFARKTEEYTNMLENGKIEGGNTLIVESMQISVFIPHRDFNAFTSNTGLPSTGAPSSTDTNSAINNLLALHFGTYFTFSQPNHGNFAEGKLLDFPSDRSIGAAFGGATPEGFVQVGMGVPQPMRYVRVLQTLHHFDVQMLAYRTITFPMNVIIEIGLCGLKLVS
jgi:hypothetical protein